MFVPTACGPPDVPPLVDSHLSRDVVEETRSKENERRIGGKGVGRRGEWMGQAQRVEEDVGDHLVFVDRYGVCGRFEGDR